MLLRKRGTLILDESPNDLGGKVDDTDKADDGSKVATDSDATKNNADKTKDGGSDDSANQKKADDKKTSISKVEEDDAKGDGGSDDDDLTKASASVATKYRRVKQENAGLKDQIKTLSEVEEENEHLKAEIAKINENNVKLKLAGKYGVNPKMLQPIMGTEEEIETWLRENVGLATDDLAATKSDDSKKDDADKDKKSDKADKVDDADKTDKSTGDKQILDIDGKRPASSKDKASISDMSVEEIRKRALANL